MRIDTFIKMEEIHPLHMFKTHKHKNINGQVGGGGGNMRISLEPKHHFTKTLF